MADFGGDSVLLPFSHVGASAGAALDQIYTMPFAGEVAGGTLTSSAATDNDVTGDVQVAPQATGTFASVTTSQTLANVTGAMTSTQLYVDFTVASAGQSLEVNGVYLIGSEQVQVTALAGSPVQSPSGVGVQRATITRGYNSTSPAAHLDAVAIADVKLTILNTGLSSGLVEFTPGSATFAKGDKIKVVTVTGGTNVTCLLHVIKR